MDINVTHQRLTTAKCFYVNFLPNLLCLRRICNIPQSPVPVICRSITYPPLFGVNVITFINYNKKHNTNFIINFDKKHVNIYYLSVFLIILNYFSNFTGEMIKSL